MNLSRLRSGEIAAAIGGVVLLLALFAFNWYDYGSLLFGHRGGGAWDSAGFFGVIANLIILAAALIAIGLALMTATSRSLALPVATSAVTAAFGIAAIVMVLGRMLMQPGSNQQVDLDFGIFLALVGAILVAYGGWQSMQEDGTSFAEARAQVGARIGSRQPPPRDSV
jgi:hypothetical protein